MSVTSKSKRPALLLADMYEWAEAYPASDPRRNVTGWFARNLPGSDRVDLRTAGVADDMGAAAAGVDGVIISGSPRDAWAADAVNDRALALIERCRRDGIPLLGVCYGHQLLGRALGAKVGRHPAGLELGNATIRLTEAGRASPLFESISDTVSVIESHQDAVLELPEGATLLAKGDHTEVQAFEAKGHLFGIQFHPEMDPEVLQFVWGEPRRALWRSRLNFDLDERLGCLRATPGVTRVFQNFVEHYVL